jgi:hypothetical protein
MLGFSAYINASYNFKITTLYQSQKYSLTTKMIEKLVLQENPSFRERSEICSILEAGEVFGENASAALIQGINDYSLLRNNKELCNFPEATP